MEILMKVGGVPEGGWVDVPLPIASRLLALGGLERRIRKGLTGVTR